MEKKDKPDLVTVTISNEGVESLPTVDEVFDDLDKFSREMYFKNYGTPESRKLKREERKAKRKELLKEYPHLDCYSMSEEEADAAAEFWDEHECPLRGSYRGAIGGGNDIIFSPTSIGTAVKVRCLCGAEKNVTDYGSW